MRKGKDKYNTYIYINMQRSDLTRPAPFRGFVENINEESELRNQIFALQRSEKGLYVPQSFGDLYFPISNHYK